MRLRFSVVVAALWWGSLSGLGFLVVPMLFAQASSPAVAGALAAKLFSAQTWLSIACAMLLLMMLRRKDPLIPDSPAAAASKLAIAGLLLAVLVEFGVAPRIVSARTMGGDLRLWHGLGTAMYFAQWLCAAASLWHLTRGREPAAGTAD